MKKFLLIAMSIILLFACQKAFASVPTQTVRGTVLNNANKMPVRAATAGIEQIGKGAISGANGNFTIENVPIGRYTLTVSLIGFDKYSIPIVVTSGREVVLEIGLQESFVLKDEIVVTAERGEFAAINEAAIVSSVEFTVDDARRFAGSREDPARMAQSFAGVLGANDSRNDIIIRGGSPTELLWRIDGMDVPNPNHFATQGATGGPVNAINTNLLSNSDFLTGAFPAEYGDKLSGVFDLNTRRGNNQKYEYTGQFGFNGFELGAEGPLNFLNSSFILNYRYSFMGLLDAMGIDFGFSGIPYYQDATFKADFDINDFNHISITGLWGTSAIDLFESTNDKSATGDFDLTNATDLHTVAVNWRSIFSEKLYGKLIIGTSSSTFKTTMDSLTIDRSNSLIDKDLWMDINSKESFNDIKYSLFYSPNSRNSFAIGGTARYRFYDLYEERFTANYDSNEPYKLLEDGSAMQYMAYVNWNWRLLENLTTNIGIHSQYFELSDKYTIEPRAALRWSFLPRHSLSLGFGVHSQSQPLITYFEQQENRNLDFTQALHYIAGYSYVISNSAFMKLEAYYKDISKAPIEIEQTSFSLLNAGANFGRVFTDGAMSSRGLGKTYGAEFSLIKHFSDGYYFTATGSYVRQQYKASDQKWRWGAFDNRFILNLLAGYEWKISSDFIVEFACKYTLAGGAPYTPVDTVKSRENNTTYLDSKNAFSLRMPNYSRFDMRIDFRHNYKNWAVISYISVENLLNSQNVLTYFWSASENRVKKVNQLGVFPIGGVRFEF